MSGSEKNGRYFVRLTLSQRVQHLLLLVSTSVLIITGFMLQGEGSMIQAFGSASDTVFRWRGWIHRGAAVVGITVCVYHMVYVVVSREGRSWFIDMVPRPKDIVDVCQNMMYMLGMRTERPKMDRFFYLEKLEYWSVWFGMFVVIVTGSMLWTEYLWPEFVLRIASAFHLGEATLATLAIIVGHIYAVHYSAHTYPLNRAFLDGLISEHLMKEEHMLQYEREMARADGPEGLAEGGGRGLARLIDDYRNAMRYMMNRLKRR